MKKIIVFAAAFAAFLTLTAASVFAEPGRPIQGQEVGLDHEPPGGIMARAATNGEGNVTFNNLKPGRYTSVLVDTSSLKVPCRVQVTFNKGGAKLPLSELVMPGKRGAQGFAFDRSGRKLTVVIAEAGGSISVHVSSAEGQSANPGKNN